MANIFGFGGYGGFLGHYFKFHVECSTFFHWFDYMLEFNEEENGVRVMLELCKIQMFFAISSNIQDVYNYTHSSYFLRQEHSDIPPEVLDLSSIARIEEEDI